MSEQRDEYNRGGMIAFLFSMSFVFLFFIYISFIQKGVSLDENVRAVDDGSVAPVVTFDMATVTEPWKENADVAKYGAKVYSTNCAVCHGKEAKGDGPGGMALNPKPRNLIEGKWKAGGDSISLFNTLTHGLQGTQMVAFGHLKAQDRWALVQFIHSVTQNKTADDAAKLDAFGKTAK